MVPFFQAVVLLVRRAGAQANHPGSSLESNPGLTEFSSIKKSQRVLVPVLVSFFFFKLSKEWSICSTDNFSRLPCSQQFVRDQSVDGGRDEGKLNRD